MDRRLQKRYVRLVNEHSNAANQLAAGISALPGTGKSFACTQALWRFLKNPAVTLPALAEPMLDLARETLADNPSPVVLVVHDWSMLNFAKHSSKSDRFERTHSTDVGYELSTSLLVEASEGMPVAVAELSLRTSRKVLTTRKSKERISRAHVDQVGPAMDASETWELDRCLVHIVDREADSVAHYRQWNQAGHDFVVRADANRRVRWRGESIKLPDVVATLHKGDAFQTKKEVKFRGKKAFLQVAETTVLLDRPAKRRQSGKQKEIAGEPLELRLVVSRIVDAKGKKMAEWLLFSNVESSFDALTIAQWYYWRWQIESYFKLLKSAGVNVESWQQDSGEAIAKRLLIASMACVVVWLLLRTDTPQAQAIRIILVRLSGRQMKWGVESTAPALLAGLHALLAMLDILQEYSVSDLRHMLKQAMPFQLDSS